MTTQNLTAQLAKQIMQWDVGPDRFLMGERRWMPRERFQPTERIQDAFRLLERAAPQDYTMRAAENGGFWVRVCLAGATGEAREQSKPRAITFAIARAVGIEVESTE